jgi:hypothetical protein
LDGFGLQKTMTNMQAESVGAWSVEMQRQPLSQVFAGFFAS